MVYSSDFEAFTDGATVYYIRFLFYGSLTPFLFFAFFIIIIIIDSIKQ